MPARRDLTPAQALERIERKRAADREAARRYRARRRDVGLTGRSDAQARQPDAAPEAGPVSMTPPHTPPVSSFSLKERRERKKFAETLSAFAGRGYVADDRFWELLQGRYPHLDLELEVLKLAEWLDEPRNQKRKCSKGFISNWLSKADVDRQQREAQARTLPPTGGGGSGQAPRPSPGRPPDPAPVLPADVTLQRIDPAVAARHLLDAKRLTLPEKLALAKNGKP